MEQDGSEIVPRGEIPSEAEFARLLCDKTFVDYFNVFLSLPVFSQRLLFKISDQSFELDPPLKRNQYRVDRIKLMRWVRTKRAPFFFKSDLYLEYLLCKQLQKSQLHLVLNYGPDATSAAKEKMMDHCLMTRWLKRASGMRRFRCFISETVGENSVQFWLDTERFRRTANLGEEKWAVFYRKMETKYFKSRNVKLPGDAQISQLQLYQSSLSSATDTDTTDANTIQRVTRDTCLAIQGFILKSLQNYWVPRYLIHCKQRFTKFSQTSTFKVYRPNCYAIRVRSLSEISKDDESESDGKGGIPSDIRSHHGIRKAQLLKQSVGNLMSMFSSNQVRRSQLSTLLKVEDIGELVRGGPTENEESGEDDSPEMKSKGHDWLTEEFPLPAISEESANYRSRSTSPIKRTPSTSESTLLSSPSCQGQSESDHGSKDESPLFFSGKTSKMSSRRSSARRSTSPRRSVTAGDDDDDDDIATGHTEDRRSSSGRRSRRGSASRRGSSRRGSSRRAPSQNDEEKQESTDDEESSSSSDESTNEGQKGSPQPTIPMKQQKDLSQALSTDEPPETDATDGTDTPIKTDAESEDMTSDEPKPDGHKHRGKIADLNKFRRNSDQSSRSSSSRDSSSTSVGHSSTSAGSLISLSKRRMSIPASGITGVLPRPPGVAKPPPKRRSRSQSVEFRLGDFSIFIDKQEEKKASKKKLDSRSDSNKEIKLEADLQALKALQKDREKRKKERLKQLRALKRKKARQQSLEASSDSEVPDLGGDDALFSSLKKLAMRRRGTVAPLQNINRTALKKLEQLHSISLNETERHQKFSDSIKNQQGMFMSYSLLPFEDKLREDDRRLMLVCNLPEALEVIDEGMDSMDKLVPRRTEMLPAIKSQQSVALNITKLRLSGYNLGEADFRTKNRLLVSAVLSDKFAGWPWMKFLVRYSYFREQQYLKFWHAAQDYLDAGHRDLMREKLADELVANFLQSADDRKVNIGRLLTAELKNQLGANSGDELLLHAQDLACEALRDVWAVFQRHDVDSFLSRTSERKNAQQRAYPLYTSPTLNLKSNRMVKPSPPEAVGKDTPKTLSQVLADARKTGAREDVKGAPSTTKVVQESGDLTNSVAPYRIMRAVEICTGLPLAGITDADLGDPSDPDEDSDDEGSLRRRNMIVLRKRKVKSPVPVEKAKPGKEDIRKQTQSRHKRSSHGYLSPRMGERDQETVKTGICRAIRKGGKTIHRPSRPRSFMEVLHDQSHFEFFRRYLQVEVGNELPLSFWQSVEQLRMGNTRDAKVRQAKAAAIVKKFFNKSTNFGGDLLSTADIILDIPTMEKVTPQMLMSAQTCVAKTMEDKWYGEYKESYTDDTIDQAIETPTVQFGQEGRTHYLWSMFITNVCQFRRGLMTPWLLSLFKEYLGKEVIREVEKQKETGIASKRIIGGKIVIVDKLQNDLCFWAEVERFKQLADNAARAAAAGTYTIEDEEYVQKKANAIIDVFLDSFVPPRVQINVPQEIADDIIDIAQHGIVERGLFHYAALNTFTVLLYCWKKFTRERLSYKSTPAIFEETTITASSTQPKPTEYLAPGEFGPRRVAPPPKKKPKKKRKSSTPRVCGVKIKTIVGTSPDDAPRMFFTIENGVQLILPPKPQPEHESKDRYRNLMQTLINSGHEEDLLQLFQQPAALGLGLAQQRRLSRTIAMQFPALLKQQ